MIARKAGVIWRITLIGQIGDVEIDDRHQIDTLIAHIADQPLHVRKRLLVDGERPVAILIVDIEPDDVEREIVLAESRREIADRRVRTIAPPRLLVAQRPFRRERRLAGEIGVAANDVTRRRSRDQIIIDRPVRPAHREGIGVAVAEIEPGPPGVVEQDAIAAAIAAHPDEERDRFVDRIGAAGKAEGIGVPIDIAVAAAIKVAAGLVAQAVDVLGDRQALVQGEGRAIER